jgi:spore germination protein YaaH
MKKTIHISSWFIYSGDKDIQCLEPVCDILDSVSIAGKNVSEEFIRDCKKNGMETAQLVSGGASNIESANKIKETVQSYMALLDSPGFDGIDVDYEHLDVSTREKFSDFMLTLYEETHKRGKKLTVCVGYWPAIYKEKYFYDPVVLAKTCDFVKVMCYDQYYAPGRTCAELSHRADCRGLGPTCAAPYAKDALDFWTGFIPPGKTIMGLPSYSNDYDLTTGSGTQVYDSRPPAGSKIIEDVWLWHEKVRLYRYLDGDEHIHLFYASDSESTAVHLDTVIERKLAGISFWEYHSVKPETWKIVRDRFCGRNAR